MQPINHSNGPDNELISLNIDWDGLKREIERLVDRSFATKRRELRRQIRQELLNELRGTDLPDDDQSISSEDLSNLSNCDQPTPTNEQQIVEVLKIDGRANHTSYFVRWSNGDKSWVQSGEVNVPHNLRRRYWNKNRIERERLARQSEM